MTASCFWMNSIGANSLWKSMFWLHSLEKVTGA